MGENYFMEKKQVSIFIIVACLVVAVLIMLFTRNKATGIESIKSGNLIWTICNSADCGANSQMEKRDYYAFVQEARKQYAMSTMDVPIKCTECEEMSVVKAMKCANCGTVFQDIFVLGGSPDRCPECAQNAQ